jgi:hypothetical protein
MPSIAFRPLAVDDLQQIFLWLIRPHVAAGYAKPPGSFMEAVAKYGPRAAAGNVVRAFMVNVDGKDAGYARPTRSRRSTITPASSITRRGSSAWTFSWASPNASAAISARASSSGS